MTKGLQHMTYEGTTERTGWLQTGQVKAKGDVMAVFQCLEGSYRGDGARRFSVVHNKEAAVTICNREIPAGQQKNSFPCSGQGAE